MRARIASFVLILMAGNVTLAAEGTQRHIELRSTSSVSKAAFDFSIPRKPEAVLVLSPGANGDGKSFLDDKNWTEFATRQGWAVAAVTFVSPVELLKKNAGYYDVAKESGKLLFAALGEVGLDKVPIYAFGFSGGARFSAGLAMTYPESVAGWAAHAPSDVVKIPNGDLPMGIVACGDNDPRLGATLAWFKDFCASGRRATWVEIPNDAHVRNGKFESFVRDWFAAEAVRRNCKGKGMWCDLGNGEPIASGAACAKANRSWFPSKSVYEKWRNLVADMSRKVEVRRVHTQIKANPTLTLFLMPSTNVSKRVLCLSLLANRPSDVAWLLRKRSRKGTVGSFLDYAEENDMAVVAWGAPRGLWKPRFNWEDLRQDENRHIFRSFGYAANAWCKAMDGLASDFGLPRTGYYMAGSSGAAQFAQRLALHAPERFRAVAIHISSSYDYPLSSARSILWCVTTGENEPGYERSLRFLEAARSNKYPIIYKAYPGLGHADYPFACTLAKTCFAYATEGKSREGLNSDSWTIVADVVNQSRHPRCLADEVPLGFRIFLPDEKVAKAWERF